MARNTSFLTTSPLAGLPTELVRHIAEELQTDDLARFSSTSRKICQDVKAILFKNAVVNMHSMDPKLALLGRSLRKNPHLFMHLRSLDLRFISFDMYPYVTIRGLRRKGAKYPADKLVRQEMLYGWEHMHLENILQGSRGLRHLNLEVLGDLLPAMQIEHGFQHLKTLHLGRFPHEYGGEFPDDDDFGHARAFNTTSLQDLVWIFELPQLDHLSLYKFNEIGDVGLISSSKRRSFKIRSLVFKETSIAKERGCFVRDSFRLFFAAFERLEAVEWYLQPCKAGNLDTVSWIVGGLGAHRSTLRHLLVRENNIPPWGRDLVPPTNDFSSGPKGISFARFTALESLTVVGRSLAYSPWNGVNHKFSDDNEADNVLSRLPRCLKRLTVAQFAWAIEPALHLTAQILLQAPLHEWRLHHQNERTLRRDLDVSCSILPELSIHMDSASRRSSSPNWEPFTDGTYIAFMYGRVPRQYDDEVAYPGMSRRLVKSYCDMLRLKRSHLALLQ